MEKIGDPHGLCRAGLGESEPPAIFTRGRLNSLAKEDTRYEPESKKNRSAVFGQQGLLVSGRAGLVMIRNADH